MGLFRGAAKTAIAAKLIDVVRREAAKPENQRKIKDLISKAQSKRGGGRRY